MKIAHKAPTCAVVYIEDGQGRRLVIARESLHSSKVVEEPVVIANNKADLDRTIRILASMRDNLPDAPKEGTDGPSC